MATGINIYNNLMTGIWISNCIDRWPLWRKIAARFFEKYRLSKEEYENFVLGDN